MLETRLEKIQKALKEVDMQAILITSPYNLRYATNFTGTAGLAVITQDKGFFITDFRYTEQAAEQASDYEIVRNTGSVYAKAAEVINACNLDEVGAELDHLTVNTYTELDEQVDPLIIDASGLVETLREVKEPKEIDIIQQAIKITESAYEYILETIRPGMTEIEVANELDFYMRKQGATSVSFDTIVASGARSALPHGVASDKKIQKDELITIDFGCYYNGYVSDMTRTFAIGKPESELIEIYGIVREAHRRVHEAARPGITGVELDAVARDYITEQGYGEQFGHTTGHGIGLEIHEGPNVSHRNDEPFVENNIVTNEPGIYLAGRGGVRIEDDILITADGSQNLMTLPTDLIQL